MLYINRSLVRGLGQYVVGTEAVCLAAVCFSVVFSRNYKKDRGNVSSGPAEVLKFSGNKKRDPCRQQVDYGMWKDLFSVEMSAL